MVRETVLAPRGLSFLFLGRVPPLTMWRPIRGPPFAVLFGVQFWL